MEVLAVTNTQSRKTASTTKVVSAAVGRPRKFSTSRTKIAGRFSPEIEALLKHEADLNRCSVSEQLVKMIEELVHKRAILAAVGADTSALEEAVFRRHHRPMTTAYGKAWWPKADPAGPPAGGFFKMRRTEK
jgi:hypothetical protein